MKFLWGAPGLKRQTKCHCFPLDCFLFTASFSDGISALVSTRCCEIISSQKEKNRFSAEVQKSDFTIQGYGGWWRRRSYVCANITQLAPRVKEAVWTANSMYQEFDLAVEKKQSAANLLPLSNISHHRGYCQAGDNLLQMPSSHIHLWPITLSKPPVWTPPQCSPKVWWWRFSLTDRSLWRQVYIMCCSDEGRLSKLCPLTRLRGYIHTLFSSAHETQLSVSPERQTGVVARV